jgi:hypothetical protein
MRKIMNLAKMTGSIAVLAALVGNMSAQVVTIPGSVVNPIIVDSLAPSFGQLTVSGWTALQTEITAYLQVSDAGGIVNGDYYATLVHNGQTAVLLNRVGRTFTPVFNDNGYADGGFNITFKNGAPNVHTYQDVTGPLGPSTKLTGTWSPDGRTGGSSGPGVGGQGLTETVDAVPKDFSVFNGQNLNGLWTFTITDMASGGQGRLDGWGITLTAVPEPQEYALIFGLGLAAFAIYRRRTQVA